MSEKKLVVYGTPVCPMVPPVTGMLKRSQVAYDYVDIWQDDEARNTVRSINNGNESVPTLVFPDGSTLTEPRDKQLMSKLSELGYVVQEPTLKNRIHAIATNPTLRIGLVIFAGFGLFGDDPTLGYVGLGIWFVLFGLGYALR